MNQSLASLYFRRLISLQTAMSRSSHPDELQEIIARGPAALGVNVGGAATTAAAPER
jgi:twitching motility protein PilT